GLGGIGGDDRLRPGRRLFEGLAHRVEVAHAVVDHRDANLKVSHRLEGSLGGRHHPGHARVRLRRHAQRAAKGLEDGLDLVVALTPRRLSMCRVTPAWLTKPWKNSYVSCKSKAPTLARVKSTCISSPGRPEKSTTTRDSASSRGT